LAHAIEKVSDHLAQQPAAQATVISIADRKAVA